VPEGWLKVEVVYALPDEQTLIALEVEEGTTVKEAIERSGILSKYPGVAGARERVGIFGKPVDPDTALRDGDRIEIYRPLVANPKEARRSRVASTKRQRG
jgi:uncharacterized protein